MTATFQMRNEPPRFRAPSPSHARSYVDVPAAFTPSCLRYKRSKMCYVLYPGFFLKAPLSRASDADPPSFVHQRNSS